MRMKFETKYDIGQKLWRIKIDPVSIKETCECCGHPHWDKKNWIVDELECEIVGVYCDYIPEKGFAYTSYKIWTPCVVVRECLSEQGFEAEFYLTLQAAQA